MTELVVEETMSGSPDPAPAPPSTLTIRSSRWARLYDSGREFSRSHKLGVASGIVIVVMIFVALFADVVAPYDPVATTRGEGSRLGAPSSEHWFGTDELGRDIFSRVIHGARISMVVATLTVLVSTVLGTIVGAVSGYLGGRVDTVLQRIVDAVMSIPVLILALFVVSLLGSSIRNVVMALAIVFTPRFARIARGEMLRIKTADYVSASQALGARPWRIIRRHGFPNLTAPIIVLASLTFGQAMIAEAGLSFLGVGAPITEPSWGQMLSRSREYLTIAWWTVVFPGAALSLAVLAFNLFGDALRDHLDPKLVR